MLLLMHPLSTSIVGSIFCLESGCQKTIALDRRAALNDGGYAQGAYSYYHLTREYTLLTRFGGVGLGSFHKYQLHARQDPAHGISRLRRVERERMERPSPVSLGACCCSRPHLSDIPQAIPSYSLTRSEATHVVW